MSRIFPQLYAKSSTGKIKTWIIEARNNVMIIRSGYTDGKMAERVKIIKGKNIGRSNETSDERQCELECQSKWQEKIDEQYATDQGILKAYADQEILLPMLAHRYQDRKKDIKFPCYVQPKLNGVRCIYQGGKFMSRKGKEYTTLSHLIEPLKRLDIAIPDGEIYIHGMSFQEIIRRVKKDRGLDTQKLEYWIYDQINEDTFEDRQKIVARNFLKSRIVADPQAKLKYVPTEKAENEKEIKEWHDKFVQQGYEGVIIRNKDGKYKVKHRSSDLQKYKEFKDAEFEITGGHEGSGSDAGTVIFEVKNKAGSVFSVRPRGTVEMRQQWFKDLNKLIGKDLTVRYQELSENGIPIFPVGLTIRDYE